MLILTRKKNETLCIGDEVVVTIIRVSGNKVRLGISAPRDMRVVRDELAVDEQEDAEVVPQVVEIDIAA